MLARVDQELHFWENTTSEYVKLPCCINQAKLFLEDIKLKVVSILDITAGKSMFRFMASTTKCTYQWLFVLDKYQFIRMTRLIGGITVFPPN